MNKLSTLTALAGQINERHRDCELAARSTIDHARRAGVLLIEAKSKLGHGEWLPWLAEHVNCSTRTAQNYIRVARRWPELEAKYATAAHLTLRDGLQLLVDHPEPDEKSADRRQELESGTESAIQKIIDNVRELSKLTGEPIHTVLPSLLSDDPATLEIVTNRMAVHA